MDQAMEGRVVLSNFVTHTFDLLFVLDVAHINRRVGDQLADLLPALGRANHVNDPRPHVAQHPPDVVRHALPVRHAEHNDRPLTQL